MARPFYDFGRPGGVPGDASHRVGRMEHDASLATSDAERAPIDKEAAALAQELQQRDLLAKLLSRPQHMHDLINGPAQAARHPDAATPPVRKTAAETASGDEVPLLKRDGYGRAVDRYGRRVEFSPAHVAAELARMTGTMDVFAIGLANCAMLLDEVAADLDVVEKGIADLRPGGLAKDISTPFSSAAGLARQAAASMRSQLATSMSPAGRA